jgi:hypothetical protein
VAGSVFVGCAGVKVYEASTGEPVRDYEVTLRTLGEFEPVTAQFHIVRMVNRGKYQYEPEYYDILKEAVISSSEAEKTMSLRMVIRITNPSGIGLSLAYRARSLPDKEKADKGNWILEDEVVYSGKERDIVRSIDCPMTSGRHEAGVWVYRDTFLLFEFGNFKYKVESGPESENVDL